MCKSRSKEGAKKNNQKVKRVYLHVQGGKEEAKEKGGCVWALLMEKEMKVSLMSVSFAKGKWNDDKARRRNREQCLWFCLLCVSNSVLFVLSGVHLLGRRSEIVSG
jgi:hypothetical protein